MAGVRSSRLVFQVEKKKQVIVFQVNEAVPALFGGVILALSKSNNRKCQKLPGNIWDQRENMLHEGSLFRADIAFQAITCSVGLCALSPVTDYRGKKKSLQHEIVLYPHKNIYCKVFLERLDYTIRN